MLSHANRANTRSATAVRDSKCLVQVQVANIGANGSGIGNPHLGVHIRAIHIHLSARLVDNVAHLLDFYFKNTVRGRISDHECGEIVAMYFYFFPQIIHIDVSFLIRCHRNRGKTGLYRTCGIGSMCRSGDKYCFTMSLANAFQVAGDDHQSGKFSGSPRIGL
ncbi:hypothetical protein SDC9_109755 [bioreactor metagenome]|uniref:Uncharacterized protein n=1 Tax=bioreactor metagenome TaxID=1076179 RepID=A0A645BC31_9ZZZZ